AHERATAGRVLDRRAKSRRPSSRPRAFNDALQPRPVEADHQLTANLGNRNAHLARAADYVLGRRAIPAQIAFHVRDTLRAKELLDLAAVWSSRGGVDYGPF